MPQSISRHEYLLRNRSSRAWATLNHALNQQMRITADPCMPAKDSLNGKHVVVIGSGVAGLTTAYELLSRNSKIHVTILEARDRTGGRCLSLRTGDTLTEDKDSQLHSTPGRTQVVRFERPAGDSEPYLNAGPGRIPSSHKHLLSYLKRFGVEVEVYVMASSSNMSQMEGGPEGDGPLVNRRLDHNTRGWLAQMVFKNADQLVGETCGENATKDHVTLLQSLMVTFGDLDTEGNYVVGTAKPGEDDSVDRSDRAGFLELPGVRPGVIAEAIQLDRLLESEFWKKTRIYQPEDFLWQPTLFQPVGGMDRVQHAFAQQVATLGGMIHLNCPVTNIDYEPATKQYLITAKGHAEPFRADYCFSNMAMPFLETVLADNLQATDSTTGFDQEFKDALHAVYAAQANDDATHRFLACTSKVGWQANRDLWQGKPFTTHTNHDGASVLTADSSEVGEVPIYGGISWTDHEITQIWYPSNAYHDREGVLTGCYNFGTDACRSGHMDVNDRLIEARAGAARFSEEFSKGLKHGVAIAWQNMAYIKGGWAQWDTVTDSVNHYNHVIQGTGVNGSDKPTFFVVGDQVSSLPGWQEGAIASALNAISRLARPDLKLAFMSSLPDTRVMVEGL